MPDEQSFAGTSRIVQPRVVVSSTILPTQKESFQMKVNTLFRLSIAFFVSALALIVSSGTALAHGHVEVGKYEIVIGFKNEPAIQSEVNGLDLRVMVKETGAPVIGLADTLKAEINYGATTQPLVLRASWGEDGAYTADLLPTAVGDYNFHIFGTIEGEPVDVSMTSSPDTFSSVRTKESIAFPAPEATPTELAAATAAAQQTAMIALVVGGIGLAFGLSAWRAGREQPARATGRAV